MRIVSSFIYLLGGIVLLAGYPAIAQSMTADETICESNGNNVEACARAGDHYNALYYEEIREKTATERKSRAVELYIRACEGGHAKSCDDASNNLPLPEKVQKYKLLIKSCELGYARNCYALGRDYETGIFNVAQDKARALELYIMACEGGHAEACPKIDELKSNLISDKSISNTSNTEAKIDIIAPEIIAEANAIALQNFGAEIFGPDGTFRIGEILIGSPAFLHGMNTGDKFLETIFVYTAGTEGLQGSCADALCAKELFEDPNVRKLGFSFGSVPDSDTGIYTRFRNYRYGGGSDVDTFFVNPQSYDHPNSFGLPLSQFPASQDPDIWQKYLVFNAFGLVMNDSSNVIEYVAPLSPAYFGGFKAGEAITQIEANAIRSLGDLSLQALSMIGSTEFVRVKMEGDNGGFYRQIFIAGGLLPIKAGYAPEFDPEDPTYASLIVKMRGMQEEQQASSRKNRAILNALQGLAQGGGSISATISALGELIDETEKADYEAYYARSRGYALEGKICTTKPSVIFCYNTSDNVTKYLGGGFFQTNTTITNHCPEACAGHSGFCDTESGDRYFSVRDAELANCRVATSDELEPFLKVD